MSTQLTNPLQSLLAAAGKSLPRATGATDAHRSRHERAGDASVVLLDASGSMAGAAWGGRRKIDLLRDAVAGLAGGGHRLVAFADAPRDAAGGVPDPAGGTALHLALDHVAPLRPRHTLVISDGQPDDEAAGLAAAARLSGTIDVLYVGPDADVAAIAFMRRLARVGGGRADVNDVARPATGRPLLAESVRRLLPAPGGR